MSQPRVAETGDLTFRDGER